MTDPLHDAIKADDDLYDKMLRLCGQDSLDAVIGPRNMISGDPNGFGMQGPTVHPLIGLTFELGSGVQEYRFREPVTLEAGDLIYAAVDQNRLVGYIVQRADGTVERHIEGEDPS